MQKGNSEIETKSQPESWVKFIAAMSILAIFEFIFLGIPGHRGMIFGFYLLNLIFAPFIILWVGTLFSPANKKITCYTIAVVLSIIVMPQFIKGPLSFDPGHNFFNLLLMGIFYIGIIWINARRICNSFTWSASRSESQHKPSVFSIGDGIAIVILLFLMGLSAPKVMSTRRSAWMSQAGGTLRSTGSSQLGYQQSNIDRNFGSFQDLQHTLYIAEGYNLGNMIENYSMTWSVYNSPSIDSESSGIQGIHTFTIVAYPRDTYPGYLQTFGIMQDQVVRMYNPDSVLGPNEYNGLYDPRVPTWDPIL